MILLLLTAYLKTSGNLLYDVENKYILTFESCSLLFHEDTSKENVLIGLPFPGGINLGLEAEFFLVKGQKENFDFPT